MILGDNKKWAQVARSHFVVKGFLDSSVVDKDKVSEIKLECLNYCLVVSLKLDGGFDPGCDDGSIKVSETRATLLECNCLASNKVSS